MQISVTRSIGAPSETVWGVLADVERWPEWTPTITSVERRTDGALGRGSQVHIRQPKLRPATWTITEWNPSRGFTWKTSAPGFRIVADHSIRTDGPRCSIELRVRFEGVLGGILGRLYGGITERYMGQEADGLRARCEGLVASR